MGIIRDLFKYYKLRGKRGTVRRMFFERAENFSATTKEILSQMSGVLAAASALIEEKESFKNGGVLDWIDVTLAGADMDEALSVLVGVVSFTPGSEVELQNGDKVKVTPDTSQYFIPRMIRLGVPLNLAGGTKEDVIAYLKKVESEQKEEHEQIESTIKDILSSDVDVGAKIPVNIKKKQQDTLATAADFDLTQLTEDQRQQLVLLQRTTEKG